MRAKNCTLQPRISYKSLPRRKQKSRRWFLGKLGKFASARNATRVTIGFPPSCGNFIYCIRMSNLKIVMEATHYPLEKLLAGNLDVGLVTDVVHDDNIEYIELFQDEMVAVVNGMHEWSERKYVEAEDFAKENLFIHSLPINTVTVHEMVLKPANVKPKKITVLPMTEACLEMVKAEMGIIVMAKWA